jgi:iron complex outermembrane receptor protein
MKLISTLCGSASLLVMASTAAAQTAAAPEAPTLDTVVVTATRIIRNGYSAPTPITVAPVDQLMQTTPSSIPDGLNKLPQFAGSSDTASSSNAGGAANVFGGNFLNLRSFGPIRTLILLDGRRVPATSLSGQTDVNILPQMLVERVDVVTGGASAVYGSDAVTGVVNFVLDKHFRGLKLVAQGGASTYNDAGSYRFGIAGGGAVLDRGYVIWSAERYQNNGVTRKENRPWAASVPVYSGSGTQDDPYVLVHDVRISNSSFGGLATSGPFKGQQFLPNGSLAAFNPGTPITPTAAIGGDGGYINNLTLTSPILTNQLFGRFEYGLADNLTAYAQLAGVETTLDGQRLFLTTSRTLRIGNDNPFLTPSEQAQLGATPSFTLNRLPRDLAYDTTQYQKTDAMNLTVGLTGTVFNKFQWDAYYTRGADRVRSRINNNIILPNLYAAADATSSGGTAACYVSTTASASLFPGCVPANVLGAGNVSAAAKAFIYRNTSWQAHQNMNDFAASVTGPAFDDWAGPVSVALNAEYRTASLTQTSDANPFTAPNVSGVRLASPAAAPRTYYAFLTQTGSQGDNHVWEASAETVIPLLTEAPFAKSLEVTGAARYTDYSTSGTVTTWKYGANFQPLNDVRFRWTESRDIRAPTLTDLFAPTSQALSVFSDPVSGLSQQLILLTTGNPNLKPEVARTSTVGVVYSPSFFPRFRTSVDYYSIRIANAISGLQGNTAGVAEKCVNGQLPASTCSALIIRGNGPTAFPTAITSLSLNVAQTHTDGVDFEASYNFPLAPGRVDIRMLWAYQPTLKTQDFVGEPVVEHAGVDGLSKTRINTNIGYHVGRVTINWTGRYYSNQLATGDPTLFYASDLGSRVYHDVAIDYGFEAAGHSGQLFLAVNNLFNKEPRYSLNPNFVTAPGFGSVAVSGDDEVGRYFTLGLRMRY